MHGNNNERSQKLKEKPSKIFTTDIQTKGSPKF